MSKKKEEEKENTQTIPPEETYNILEELAKGLSCTNLEPSGEITEFISTGIPPIDATLGGGIPLGRITEIYGAESTGKTTLALQIAKMNGLNGGFTLILDSEDTIEQSRFEQIGIPPGTTMMVNADTLEESFKAIYEILNKLENNELRKDRPGLIIWDTVAATPSEGEKDRADGKDKKDGMGSRARTIRENMRSIVKKLTDKRIAFLCLNHVIANLNIYSGGDKEIAPGGSGLKFHATVRLRLTSSYSKDDPDGAEVTVYIRKSKICIPRKMIPIYLKYETGFDPLVSMVENLEGKWEEGFPIKSTGAYYYIKYSKDKKEDINDPEFKGIKFTKKTMESVLKDPEIYDFLVKECYKRMAPEWYHRYMKKLEDHTCQGANCQECKTLKKKLSIK
jgi:recombination protein RecA